MKTFSKLRLAAYAAVFAAIGGVVIWRSLAATNPNLAGDLNNDNIVDITDLSILLSDYGTTNAAADINADGMVNILDLSALLSHFGQNYSGGTAAYWKPTAAQPLKLQWMLDGPLNVNDPVQMGLRDLNGNTLPAPDVYDIDGEANSAQTVDYLHSIGKKVICYIDAGVWENYRSDATVFPGVQNEGMTYTGDPQYAGLDIIGNKDAGWAGSKWLDIRRTDILQPIMTNRMQNWCKAKHFDAIEPDEITNWSNNPGFPITYSDQITYNRAVAAWAHKLGMSIGLKGDLEQAHDLVGDFDWTLNEECFLYDECLSVYNSGPGADNKNYPGLQLFAQANKAVWVAEYPSEYPAAQQSGSMVDAATFNQICSVSSTQHFNTAFYMLGLPANGGRSPCPTTSATDW